MPLTLQPRHLLRRVSGVILSLALAGCGSDGGTDDALATSLAADSEESAATTTDTSTSTAPPETEPPTDDSQSDDAETNGPDGNICASWEDLGGFLEVLDEAAPNTDFEAVWDSIQEIASDMTQNSPEGYENELLRMEIAWGEFRIVASENDFDMDAAEDDFDLITEDLGLEDPEVVNYLATECTG